MEAQTAGPDTNDDVVEQDCGNTATVVFVGDDPGIVQSMRDAAHPWHGAWDVHFVESGEAALTLFGQLPTVDVLAAHVHASGLPIVELLNKVRQSSPHTARVVLSGQSDRESVLGLIGVAHQFMAVPVDIELLTGLIEHIRSATSTKLRDPVRTLVGQVDRLPSPPAIFQRLAEIMASEDWSIDDLANEMAQDLALTGEILKLVNSSFYGAADRVTSVNRAITLVGVDLIRYVVLGTKIFQSKDGLETWIDLDRLAHRSKAVALGARALAIRDRASSDASAVAYLAGLVSEIGLLVLGRVPDVSPSIAYPVNVSAYLGAERAMFGGDRFEVGAHLLTLWGFDSSVIDAVRQLSSGEIPRPGELSYYLVASRRLVVEQGFDPHELASRLGTKPDLDDALERLDQEADGTSTGSASAA